MSRYILTFILTLLGLALAQTPVGVERHPRLTTYRCTVKGGCRAATNYLVLDSLSHSVHQVNSSDDCGEWGSAPNITVCPTEEACLKNCVEEGIPDYSTVGVTTNGAKLQMEMIVDNVTVSPRIYLLDSTQEKYEKLHFVGGEFTFDIDATKLPCGMNSALYLSEMLADGGKSLDKNNKAGAYWGAGYCDAQCFIPPFINGVANLAASGACCNEMDIWEANSRSTQIAPHTCNHTGLYPCTGDECGSTGVCDKGGCTWNPYHVNETDLYGLGKSFTVDTTKPFTVVTQFPTDPVTGKLVEIRRLYVQDGIVIKAESITKAGLPNVDGITDAYCIATNATNFMNLGALEGMGDALARGMVLVMSIWWDSSGQMLWLDGASQGSGPCADTQDTPASIVEAQPNPAVVFSNLKWGELGSTFAAHHVVGRDSARAKGRISAIVD
ncbi:concanavalin A-like lectin/glucanase domain-containing protein [Xylariales sp. PMI_506]|nr:concanavalin A-like lectin/glucanase domain-containing protein [Xylariales sp. PMI_506]